MSVILFRKNEVVYEGQESNVCQKVASMFEERLGFTPNLQESTNNGLFQLHLHTDSYVDLQERELDQLLRLRVTEDPVIATEAIKRFLNVDFQLQW